MAERAELYVLGDSISMHYGPYLKRFLEPAVGYSRKGEGLAAGDLNQVSDANGGDSRSCLGFLETNLPLLAERFDWLLWNCGLHDIKTTAAGRQVSPECYAANLERGVELVRKSGLQLLWCRTTGVCDELHNLRCRDFSRFRADVELYNRLADRVMEEHRIPVCDLFGFTRKFGDEAFADHVHYVERVRELQGAFLAGWIFSELGNAAPNR